MEKKREHKFSRSHPVLASVLFAIGSLILTELLTHLVNFPIAALIPGYPPAKGIAGVLVSCAVVLWLFRLWFKPEFQGFLGGKPKAAMIPVAAYFVYLIVSVIQSCFTGDRFAMPDLTRMFSAAAAGFREETAFRGMIIPIMMFGAKSKKSIFRACAVSAGIFGVIHIFNVIAGAPLLATLLQVLDAAAVGIALSAIYLSCGNILPSMFMHFIHDVAALSAVDSTSSGGIITADADLRSYLNLMFCMILLGFSLWYILKKENTENILEIWNQKWLIQ